LTDIPYAVKALPKAGLDARPSHFQRRAIRLHHLASQHPNVVSLVRIFDSPECTYVVMEFCPEGDLFDNITEKGRFVGDDHLAKHAFLQILDAVHYCHSSGIYHRDLKPENILVTNHGRTVKLSDFALATPDRISSNNRCGSILYRSPGTIYLPPPLLHMASLAYHVPECHEQYAPYATVPNDVWALGVLLVNLTCGRNPWEKASPYESSFRAFLNDPNYLSSILPISSELNRILRRVFECDPHRRISLQELREAIASCPRLTTT